MESFWPHRAFSFGTNVVGVSNQGGFGCIWPRWPQTIYNTL